MLYQSMLHWLRTTLLFVPCAGGVKWEVNWAVGTAGFLDGILSLPGQSALLEQLSFFKQPDPSLHLFVNSLTRLTQYTALCTCLLSICVMTILDFNTLKVWTSVRHMWPIWPALSMGVRTWAYGWNWKCAKAEQIWQIHLMKDFIYDWSTKGRSSSKGA